MENFSIQNIELCYYFFFNIICPLNKRDFKKGIILVFKSFFLLLITHMKLDSVAIWKKILVMARNILCSVNAPFWTVFNLSYIQRKF